MFGLDINVGDMVQPNWPCGDLLKVVKRIRNGYLVQTSNELVPKALMDREILTAFNSLTFRHFACNPENLEEKRAEMVHRTFCSLPGHVQRETLRRLAYVEAVYRCRHAKRNVLALCRLVVPETFKTNVAEWNRQERDAARDAYNSKWHRDGAPFGDDDHIEYKEVTQPADRTVRDWYSEWLRHGQDKMMLVPLWGDRGNREGRFPAVSADGRTVYDIAKEVADLRYKVPRDVTKRSVFKHFVEECSKAGLTDHHSERHFRRYLLNIYSAWELLAAREGSQVALERFGTFLLRQLPNRFLEEVEVDHCLCDVILIKRVIKNGRVKKKKLGRPWITVLIDRATKYVIGIHVSFCNPSYAAVRAALAHSIFQKDLSAYPNLKNRWLGCGLPHFLISDRGKEFLSTSLRETCLLLRIITVALPGRKGRLKGTVERFFRTLGIQVFDVDEGSTKAWKKPFYDAGKRANMDLGEFKEKFITWIVDDYHQAPHDTLTKRNGRDMSPAEALEIIGPRFPIRLPKDPDDTYRLMGEVFYRKIGRDGISIGDAHYVDKAVFDQLKARPGGGDRRWACRRNRHQLGKISIFDEFASPPAWLDIPATEDLFEDATAPQVSIWKSVAQDLTPEGEAIDIAALRAAKELVQRQCAEAMGGGDASPSVLKWMQFGELGEPVTPVPGFTISTAANAVTETTTASSQETSAPKTRSPAAQSSTKSKKSSPPLMGPEDKRDFRARIAAATADMLQEII